MELTLEQYLALPVKERLTRFTEAERDEYHAAFEARRGGGAPRRPVPRPPVEGPAPRRTPSPDARRRYQREYQARRRATDPEYKDEWNRRAREGMAKLRARRREQHTNPPE